MTKIQCSNCKDIIESKSGHDFVTCSCFSNSADTKGIFIDGGNEYVRMGGCMSSILIVKEEEEISQGSYHVWGDSWPHWEELYKAEQWIGKQLYKYTLCRLSSKEKYGTLRYEHTIPPKWCWYLGKNIFIYTQWCRFADFMLIKVVNQACKKFPNVEAELLDDLYWE